MFLQMALFHFLWLSNSPLWASWWLSSQESVCQCQRCIGRRSPGEGNDNPPKYSCLGNPTDRGAWRATQSMGSQRVRHNLATEHTQYSVTRHIFFIYSAADGHVDCFHVLAIANSAAVIHWGVCILSN